MKIVIFGAGSAGKFLFDEIIKKSKGIEVVAFLDNSVEGTYKNVNILKPNSFLASYAQNIEAVFLAAGAQKTLKSMMDMVIAYKISNIYMLHDIVGKCHLSVFTSDGEIIRTRLRKIKLSSKRPTLSYFEVPVTDECNLNCKGCLFACNAISDNHHASYDQIERDARRMAVLFHDIPWIRILGGEPLMHPQIAEILTMYRNVFPESEIDLCTNGLLIPKMPDSFFENMIKNQISIHVSGYRPTYHILDTIDQKLKNHHLHYTILKREIFTKYYTTKPSKDMNINHQNCSASGCHEVYKGKLMRCSAAIAFEKFNQQFATDYAVIKEEDWFDIHKDNIDSWELKRAMDEPSSICKYCNNLEAEDFGWDYAGSKAQLCDYIIG